MQETKLKWTCATCGAAFSTSVSVTDEMVAGDPEYATDFVAQMSEKFRSRLAAQHGCGALVEAVA